MEAIPRNAYICNLKYSYRYFVINFIDYKALNKLFFTTGGYFVLGKLPERNENHVKNDKGRIEFKELFSDPLFIVR